MTLWENYMKIWEMLRSSSPEGEMPTESKESIREKLDVDEDGDKHFCIGNSDWCVL